MRELSEQPGFADFPWADAPPTSRRQHRRMALVAASPASAAASLVFMDAVGQLTLADFLHPNPPGQSAEVSFRRRPSRRVFRRWFSGNGGGAGPAKSTPFIPILSRMSQIHLRNDHVVSPRDFPQPSP